LRKFSFPQIMGKKRGQAPRGSDQESASFKRGGEKVKARRARVGAGAGWGEGIADPCQLRPAPGELGNPKAPAARGGSISSKRPMAREASRSEPSYGQRWRGDVK
jgi:hypothetical protein